MDRIANATGLTKLETEAVVDGFMVTTMEAVADGELVELRGFGTFRARLRKARMARNPRTDEPVEVPRHFLPVFKPAAEFKRVVDAAHKEAEQEEQRAKKGRKTVSRA